MSVWAQTKHCKWGIGSWMTWTDVMYRIMYPRRRTKWLLWKRKLRFLSEVKRLALTHNFYFNVWWQTLNENWDFAKILNNIEIFRKFSLKSRFPKILTKIEIFRKIWPKSRFSENFDQNRDFWKFRAKSRFSKICTKIDILGKFAPKSTFCENFYQNRGFPTILTKIKIFENFDQNIFSKHFDQDRVFQNCEQNRDFRTILTKIEIF